MNTAATAVGVLFGVGLTALTYGALYGHKRYVLLGVLTLSIGVLLLASA
ncbi:hypothetical protein [Halorubrum sp. SS7]|nr:hypothetical protein [Halorubrum sp. SS7]